MEQFRNYGEKYGPAMKIEDQAEADAYFKRLVDDQLSLGQTKDVAEAEAIERNNLGYFAGYYDSETRERVEQLFNCEHPFFGKIAEKGRPTTDEAFRIGVALAKKERILVDHHEHLWTICKKLPGDYEPYGNTVRERGDCSSGCIYYYTLADLDGGPNALSQDWGVCANPESHRCGLLTFEHQGCPFFKHKA